MCVLLVHQSRHFYSVASVIRHFEIAQEDTICDSVLSESAADLLNHVLKPLTPFRTAVVSKALGVSRLSFAPEGALEERLHLTSGSVSPLGLMFDQGHEITLCYEKGVCDTQKIAFHPCDNAATVIFTQQEFWEKVIPALGIHPVGLELPVQMDGNVL